MWIAKKWFKSHDEYKMVEPMILVPQLLHISELQRIPAYSPQPHVKAKIIISNSLFLKPLVMKWLGVKNKSNLNLLYTIVYFKDTNTVKLL